MVQLSIHSPAGNTGSRYFPHTGYLGLTPCIVQGSVRVKLDEDTKPISAKSLTVAVRCYESRLGRVNVIDTNMLVDYSITLWTKPDNLPSSELSELDCPFKIIIPLDSRGFSTLIFQEYKVCWRVEAVLEHIPLLGLGNRLVKHFDLPLIRYDIPTIPSAPRLSLSGPRSLHSTKLRTPLLRYNLSTPTSPIGPEDPVATCIYIHPLDPAVVVRSASLTIERRLNLHRSFSSTQSQPPPSPGLSSLSPQCPDSDQQTAGLLTPTASCSTITPYEFSSKTSLAVSETSTIRPLLSQPDVPSTPVVEPSRVTTNVIVSAEAVDFSRDSSGMWSKSITVQWPIKKKHSWATGETLSTDVATVRFYIRVRLYVSSPGAGTESIELDERELTVVSTNDSERKSALVNFEHYAADPRPKSKSPRRTRRDNPEQLPSPQSSIGSASSSSSYAHKQSTHNNTSGKIGSKTPRRPHTSAGPRDKSNLPYSAQPAVGLNSNPTGRIHIVSSKRYAATREIRTFQRDPPCSSKSRQVESHTQVRHRIPSDQMRDWEAELARIESQSRRSSADMLGSWGAHNKRIKAEPTERNRTL